MPTKGLLLQKKRGGYYPPRQHMEPTEGFEPTTCCLQNSYSTAELCRLKKRSDLQSGGFLNF